MADVDGQAFGRMCLRGRFREQARSHSGSSMFIHYVFDAKNHVGAGLLANSAGASVYQSGSQPFSTNRIIVNAAAS